MRKDWLRQLPGRLARTSAMLGALCLLTPASGSADEQDDGEDDEEDAEGDVPCEQRRAKRANRRTEDPEEGHRDPRLDREHVGLAVEEQRKRAPFAQVLRHQPVDGLIGIESELLEEQVGERSQHERSRTD